MSFEQEFLNLSVEADSITENKLKDSDEDCLIKFKQRSGKRQSITKCINAIRDNLPSSDEDLDFYMNKLNNFKVDILKLDKFIEEYMIKNKKWSDVAYAKQLEVCEGYIDRIDITLYKLKSKKSRLVNEVVTSSTQNLPSLKLPQLQLPTFDGKPERFKSFIDNLEQILGKFSLTPYERYTYLRQQVTGVAKQILESLPEDSLTFNAAKSLLEKAFSDKTVQQFSVINSLCNLQLNSKDKIYSWISEARQLAQQLEKLNISSEVFAQYFLWNNMSEYFQKIFISITNSSKPTLSQIIDNSFEVVNRLGSASSPNYTDSSSSLTLATKVNYPNQNNSNSINEAFSNPEQKFNYKSGCWLCKSNNHKIHNCKTFQTPEAKLNKISELKGCTRCGYLNHTVSNCKFRFSGKCKNCNKFHCFFLCVNDKKDKNTKLIKSNRSSENPIVEPVVKETHSCEVEFQVMTTSVSSDIIIPTFTANFFKRGNGSLEARSMYDPASQSTFINEKLLSKIKHKIIRKDVSIKISGFNESKLVKTNIVEAEIQFGSKLRKFIAIVIPEIKAKIKCKEIEILKKSFAELGIILADKFLGDDGSVDLLLGVDNAHILPIQSCSFGFKSKPSLIYYCAAGVMLAGNIDVLKSNLPNLYLVKSFIEKFNRNF